MRLLKLRVLVKVREGTRERLQAFEGVCIGRGGRGLNESFTVRKISFGEGVERVFPIYSPLVDSIEVVRRGKVRRAKLYYLRGRRGKSARIVENTGMRSKKLNDAERAAFLAEKERLEAEKVAAAQALAEEKAAEEASLVGGVNQVVSYVRLRNDRGEVVPYTPAAPVDGDAGELLGGPGS